MKREIRLHCITHGHIVLTHEQYMAQLARPNSPWVCPHGCNAAWDGIYHECPGCGQMNHEEDQECSHCHRDLSEYANRGAK